MNQAARVTLYLTNLTRMRPFLFSCCSVLSQACHFQLPGAIDAIKKSFMLIWRTEGTIVADIKKAFVEVPFVPSEKKHLVLVQWPKLEPS